MAREIIVETKKTKHKSQPYSVRIEQGVTDTILSQRYTSYWSGERGARRKLNAQQSPVTKDWFVTAKSGKLTWITFVRK